MASPSSNAATFTLDLDEAAVTSQPGTVGNAEAVSNPESVAREQFFEEAKLEPWPFIACCSVCVSCADDSALCCYALLCPMCLHTEMKMKMAGDERHCCLYFWGQCFKTCVIPPALHCVAANLCFFNCCCCCAHCFSCLPILSCSMRMKLGARHRQLNMQECNNPCCLHCFCAPCAMYQEAAWMKKAYGDFECCYYTCCLKTCCNSKAWPKKPWWVPLPTLESMSFNSRLIRKTPKEQTSRQMDLFGLEQTLQQRNPSSFGSTNTAGASANRKAAGAHSHRHLTGQGHEGEELHSDHPAYSGLLNHSAQKQRANPHSAKVPSKLDSSFYLVSD